MLAAATSRLNDQRFSMTGHIPEFRMKILTGSSKIVSVNAASNRNHHGESLVDVTLVVVARRYGQSWT